MDNCFNCANWEISEISKAGHEVLTWYGKLKMGGCLPTEKHTYRYYNRECNTGQFRQADEVMLERRKKALDNLGKQKKRK